MAKQKKLWGGRFAKSTAESVVDFTASVDIDRRLYRHDIAGSIAHARMLGKQHIIAASDSRKIVRALKSIEKEIEAGVFPFDKGDEDIHMNVERRLIQKIGSAGEKLHTARSRNDQVSLDMRLYLRKEINEIIFNEAGADISKQFASKSGILPNQSPISS